MLFRSVKHIVATHGGDVRVWSRLGQGSTFTILLPQAHPEDFTSGLAEAARQGILLDAADDEAVDEPGGDPSAGEAPAGGAEVPPPIEDGAPVEEDEHHEDTSGRGAL